MNQVLDDLKSALELIKDKKHWTKGVFARAPRGAPVGTYDDAATKFCAVGACIKASEARANRERAILGELEKSLRLRDIYHPLYGLFTVASAGFDATTISIIITFNDSRCHKDVVDLFKQTIKRLENEERSQG